MLSIKFVCSFLVYILWYSSVTTEHTSKRTRFSESSWNGPYSSCFHLKKPKIVENRRTIVQRILQFWTSHGFHLKYNCPNRNLMEITKKWFILINTQYFLEKSAFFCFFNKKMCNKSSTTEHTPKGPQGLLSMLSFRQSSFLLSTEVSWEAWFRSRSLADITTAREGAYRPGGSGDDGFGERDWSYKPCG